MFALTYMINYTGARTLNSVYHFNPLMIGVVMISYGMGRLFIFESSPRNHVLSCTGCVLGSLLGGAWSDHKLSQLKEANGGKSYPEVRTQHSEFSLSHGVSAASR